VCNMVCNEITEGLNFVDVIKKDSVLKLQIIK